MGATTNHNGVVNHWVNGLMLDRYATAERAAGRAQSTIDLRLYYLARWEAVVERSGISLELIDDFLSWQRWDASARRSAAGAVRSWLRWAHRRGEEGLPVPDLIELPPGVRGVPRPVDDDQVSRALDRATEDDQLAILLGRNAGLRCAEIARVHTGDVVGQALIVRGKGRRERGIPLTDDLIQLLDGRPAGYAFPGRFGGHITPGALGRRISRALGPGASAHNLRHAFATEAYRSTRDILAVRKLLGHASVSTTQVYADAEDSAARRAVEGAQLRRSPLKRAARGADTSGHGQV